MSTDTTASLSVPNLLVSFRGVTGRVKGVKPSATAYRGFGFTGHGATISGSAADPSDITGYNKFTDISTAESWAQTLEAMPGQFGTLAHSNGHSYKVLVEDVSVDIIRCKQGSIKWRAVANLRLTAQPAESTSGQITGG